MSSTKLGGNLKAEICVYLKNIIFWIVWCACLFIWKDLGLFFETLYILDLRLFKNK